MTCKCRLLDMEGHAPGCPNVTFNYHQYAEDSDIRAAEGMFQPPTQPAAASPAQAAGVQEYAGEGMFVGESLASAALGWAAWCERRSMTGLPEFLRKAAAASPASNSERIEALEALLQAEHDKTPAGLYVNRGWTDIHRDGYRAGLVFALAALQKQGPTR